MTKVNLFFVFLFIVFLVLKLTETFPNFFENWWIIFSPLFVIIGLRILRFLGWLFK